MGRAAAAIAVKLTASRKVDEGKVVERRIPADTFAADANQPAPVFMCGKAPGPTLELNLIRTVQHGVKRERKPATAEVKASGDVFPAVNPHQRSGCFRKRAWLGPGVERVCHVRGLR